MKMNFRELYEGKIMDCESKRIIEENRGICLKNDSKIRIKEALENKQEV
jgi:hypothetical protein